MLFYETFKGTWNKSPSQSLQDLTSTEFSHSSIIDQYSGNRNTCIEWGSSRTLQQCWINFSISRFSQRCSTIINVFLVDWKSWLIWAASWQNQQNDLFGQQRLRSAWASAQGERGGSVVECRTPEQEVGGSKPTAAVLCPWARHFTPRKYWLITQEAMAPSWHDWKIVDWDVKPQHKQKHQPNLICPVYA